mmetsp:Transcript_18780/g.34791  ORF Transcript_18780/g.34791 Transcript_18780/m.34791 type:complete len:335 (+) Transcript_18780:80-1084(+)
MDTPSLSFASTLAPFSLRLRQSTSCSFIRAYAKGVRPSISVASMSAPSSNNAFAISENPRSQAICNKVSLSAPRVALISTLLSFMRSSNACVSPALARVKSCSTGVCSVIGLSSIADGKLTLGVKPPEPSWSDSFLASKERSASSASLILSQSATCSVTFSMYCCLAADCGISPNFFHAAHLLLATNSIMDGFSVVHFPAAACLNSAYNSSFTEFSVFPMAPLAANCCARSNLASKASSSPSSCGSCTVLCGLVSLLASDCFPRGGCCCCPRAPRIPSNHASRCCWDIASHASPATTPPTAAPRSTLLAMLISRTASVSPSDVRRVSTLELVAP